MKIFTLSLLTLLFAASVSAQIPTATHIAILKAEDARRYDKTLEDLLKSPNVAVRSRAALAAGRIGDDRAIPALTALLFDQAGMDAAFALGEIESIKAVDAILPILNRVYDPKAEGEHPSGFVSARLIEAAGKIAAANTTDPKAAEMGKSVLAIANRATERQAILLTLTALLRMRPAGADDVVRRFLAHTDPDIVASALNTLARLRAKNANRDARDLLETHTHAIVRANAARVLGAAEDKEAVDLLVKAATTDTDPRVRVSAIRALGAIKVAKSADLLLARSEALFEAYKKNRKPNFIPIEQNEFIEISSALGLILAKTGNERAINLFREFAKVDDFTTVEPYIARVKVGRIRPGAGLGNNKPPTTYRQFSTLVQTIGALADYEPESDDAKKIKDEAPEQLRKLIDAFLNADSRKEPAAVMAAPDALQAFARFKTNDLGEIARGALQNGDVQTRAAAAGILGDLPPTKENMDALDVAFVRALLTDKFENDAELAIMDAQFKLDKKGAIDVLKVALNDTDYLLRKKAFELLADKDLVSLPDIVKEVSEARLKAKNNVFPYNPKMGTKLGQVLNTDVDYRRAVSRKNGSVKAVLTTEKGTFTINLLPEDAPLTVDNFIKLARSKYFDGLEVHRVVPNFVMQDGDPRGDGNGGPGWSIRCEVNMVPYERGAVGMALSGKDTGGSQWFVTHSPQPHLDGGYTVFGKVNETDMKVVDNIVRGDKILSVRIIGN